MTEENDNKKNFIFKSFFGITLLIYISQIIRILIDFCNGGSVDLYIGNRYEIASDIRLLLNTGTLGFGFLCFIKRRLSKARTGITIALYFIGTAAAFFVCYGALQFSGYMYLAAAPAIFILFCKEKKYDICIILALSATALGIINEYRNIGVIIDYLSLYWIFINIINICVYLMFLYQIAFYILYKESSEIKEKSEEEIITESKNEKEWHTVLIALLALNMLSFYIVLSSFSWEIGYLMLSVVMEIENFFWTTFSFIPVICLIGVVIAGNRLFKGSKTHIGFYWLWIGIMILEVFCWFQILNSFVGV